jgi:hypothetical protein
VSRSGGDSGSGTRSSGGGGATGGSYGSGYAGGSGNTGQRAGGREGSGRAMPRDGGSVTGAATGSNGGTADGAPAYARPREGAAPIGTAVPRGSVPTAPGGGGGAIYVPGGCYPGYGAYGCYDPWGWGYGYGAGYGAGYGGYYGGFYDPWYGGYPTYPQSSYTSNDEGSLKLKIKPRDAEVYVDGYFVGVVDDFDGIFQKLHIDSGAHRIEVRAPGYEPLTFDVRITPDHSTTYQGEMKKVP